MNWERVAYGLFLIVLWELSKPIVNRIEAKLKAWRASRSAGGSQS